MQILELYIRDGIKYPEFGTSAATSTSTNNLVDATADFTSGVKVGYVVFNKTTNKTAKVTAITNATTLVLSASTDGSNFFTAGNLYQIKSDFVRLDMFSDESVTITDTIKNTKDISKVFTPFSQQFNVPASKHNSKLFRHYEDNDVVNSFDARFRVDALIKLNGTDYKKGKLRLNSVTMKNNKAHAYKLVFFGETIELKDILGEDDLSRLEFPSSLNFAYDYATIKSKFISISGDVCFPLITHTKNMRYSNAGYKSTAGDFLNQFDIKPALKLRAIIEAIETTYDIDLSNDFFNSTDFRSIYMWLHRESGFMSNADEGGGLQTLEARFHQPTDTSLDFDSETDVRPADIYASSSGGGNLAGRNLKLNFDIDTGGGSDEFNFKVLRSSNNSVLYEEDFTGSQAFTLTFWPNWLYSSGSTNIVYGEGIFDVKILVTTENTLSFTEIEITATYQQLTLPYNTTTIARGVYTMSAIATSNQVVISRQIPKMKVIDFLTNIFKMFNLVAYKENDQIQALPFNDFNAQYNSYDITQYVDTSKSTIEKVLKYKSVKFGFKSKQSFLIQNQQEILGNDFAGESYPNSNDNEWDGGEFKVELDFEKMLYERLSNADDGTLSTICQGAMLDKNFSPTIGAPLLLYIKNQATSDTFKFQNSGTSDTPDDITAYNRPSQIFVGGGTVSDYLSSLNFGVEIDEFFQDVVGTNLFAKYYADYLTSIYNRQGRIKKVEAFLPLHILLNYNLNDKFIIGNKSYRINSIKTNLLTNKSSLELYTLSESATGVGSSQFGFLPRLAALNVTATSSSSVTLAWTPAGALNTDNITGYDVYKDDEFVETLGNDIGGRTLTGLDSGITFKLAIRTRYTISSTVVFSEDKIVFATTD